MDIQPYIELYTRVFKYNNTGPNDQEEREAEEREAQAQAEREAQAQAEREAAEREKAAQAEQGAQAQAEQGAQAQGANGVHQQSPDYIYYDMSKIKKPPSIYATVSNNTQTISGNALNIGDGYSYLDFKKNIKTGMIHFQRRNPTNGSLVNMEYDKTTKTLSAILRGKKIVFLTIIPEFQHILNQLT